MSKYCSHGNLLHFSLQCFRLNNRYYNQDLHWEARSTGAYAPGFSASSTPSYTPTAMERRWRHTIGGSLSHRPFSGPVHSAGELLHTPWRVPTSMATALLSRCTNTLHGIQQRPLRCPRYAFGSSRIASPAYQDMAHLGVGFWSHLQLRKVDSLPIKSLRIG